MTDTNKEKEETFESLFPSLKDRVQKAEDITPKEVLCVTCFSVYTQCLDKQLHDKDINNMIKEFTKTPIETKEVLIINGKLQNIIKEKDKEIENLSQRNIVKIMREKDKQIQELKSEIQKLDDTKVTLLLEIDKKDKEIKELNEVLHKDNRNEFVKIIDTLKRENKKLQEENIKLSSWDVKDKLSEEINKLQRKVSEQDIILTDYENQVKKLQAEIKNYKCNGLKKIKGSD